VGAENACYLGVCAEEAIGSVPALAVGGGFARGRPCDDFRLVGLKLIFLIVTRAVSALGLSRREAWWKDAEILILRHQLAGALRERPRVHPGLTWPDRVWLAQLAGTLPADRLAAMRLIVTPATILLWHRDTVRRRWARLSRRSRSGRPPTRRNVRSVVTERWIGSCRREPLDRTLIGSLRHLMILLREYEDFYNSHRPHRALDQFSGHMAR